MARFTYKALNPQGVPVNGVMRAANESDVEGQLQQINYVLITCKVFPERKLRLTGMLVKRVKRRDLIQLFVQLEQLLKVGVPLINALNHARDSTESQQLHDAMLEITREVSEGKPISEAMADFPGIFGRVTIVLVAGSEETGNLAGSFHEVIRHLKWEDRMHSRVTKATRYPKILLTIVLAVTWVMMNYVVPKVTEFLVAMEQKLPPVTRALIATSEFVSRYSLLIALMLVGIYVFVKVGRVASQGFLSATDNLILRTPVIGDVVRKISLSRFCQMFGTLFANGLDMMKCLEVSRASTGNIVIVNALQVIYSRVQEGQLLSEALAASGEFPVLVTQMVKVGEESGNLTSVMREVSEFYDKDVDEAVDAMISMIEPILTVLLGGMVIWIAAGVFGPVYDSFGKLNM